MYYNAHKGEDGQELDFHSFMVHKPPEAEEDVPPEENPTWQQYLQMETMAKMGLPIAPPKPDGDSSS